MTKKTDKTSSLFQLKLFGRGKAELLKIVKSWLEESSELHLVMTPNPEQIVQSRENPSFLTALQSADLLLPDGVGLVWAGKVLGQPLAQKITGIWLVEELLKLARQEQLKVLIIGGRDYADSDHFKYQGYSLSWTSGYKRVAYPTRDEEVELEARIRELQPQLVFVAFGAPQQELWLVEYRSLLEENNVKIAMAVGGSFDFLLGKVKRAPAGWRKFGLEWLFRLIVEPWRWRRQLRLLRFVGLVLKQRLFGKYRKISENRGVK